MSQNNPSSPYTVAIRRGVTYENAGQHIEELFARYAPPIEGKSVLIKPNVLSPAPADSHIDTHPAIVKAVLEAVLKRNPKSVAVGDNPGMRGYGANEKCFAVSGLREAAGKHYVNLGSDVVEVPFDERWVKAVQVSRAVVESDLVINVPKFKTHALTTISCAVKNTYGYLVGGIKATLHLKASKPERFAEALVEVYRIHPPEFTIVDAVVGMEGMGPSGYELRPDMGMVLAGRNAVAVDIVVAHLMGLDEKTVPTLQWAIKKGLGPADKAHVTIEGDATPVPDFKLPYTFRMKRGILQSIATKIGMRLLVSVPVCYRARCTQCGACMEHCPMKAIVMEGEYPKIDSKKCIQCYCCMEFCQFQALAPKKRVMWVHNRMKKG